MKKDLDALMKEPNLGRREFLIAGGASLLLGLMGCGKKHRRLIPSVPPETELPPTPQPQVDVHDYSGTVKDTEGNPIDAEVSLVQIDAFRSPTGVVFSDRTDSNGAYFINDAVNGDYHLQLSLPSGYFDFLRTFKIVSSFGDLKEDIVIIRKEPIDVNSVYRNSAGQPSILEMIKYISGNTTTDSVQKVRRFKDGKIKVFFNRNSMPSGYLTSLEDALSQWESQTGLPLFEETTIDRDSQITLTYESSIGGKSLSQILNLDSVNGASIPGQVKIRVKDNLSLTNARAVIAREVGHSLFGMERYSKDRSHVMFKDPNYLNSGDPLGATSVTADEGRAARIYIKLPIGLDLRSYF